MPHLTKKTADRLDSALRELYESEQLPGVSAVISHHGELIWSQSKGYADLDAGRAADADTVYHLGSLTKVFTAIMLMQLRDAGKLALEDRLDQFVPQVSQAGLPPMTLKQLVSHTSGLPLMPPLEALSRAIEEFPPRLETLRNMTFPGIEEIIAALPQVELAARPGVDVSYSNLGVALLAHAMEHAAGEEYESYVRRRILRPLEMENSGFSASVRRAANRATCYLPFGSPPQPAPFETKLIAGFTPTGGLWSSASDMSRFLAFLTGGEQGASPPVLAPASLRQMVELVASLDSSRYTGALGAGGAGIGWFLSTIQDHLLAEHGGADPSTAAYLAWAPDLELAVFIAANSGQNPAAVAAAGAGLLAGVLHISEPPAEKNP